MQGQARSERPDQHADQPVDPVRVAVGEEAEADLGTAGTKGTDHPQAAEVHQPALQPTHRTQRGDTRTGPLDEWQTEPL